MDNAFLESNVREEQLRRLMTEYGTAVLRVCYAYVKDTGLAEDAAQDTFIKAYRHLEDFQPREAWSEKAWLLRIAVNVCKDILRSAWMRHIDRNADLDTALAAAQSRLCPQERQLTEDVLRLPPRYRMVLVLYYYQNLNAEEIAQTLHISRSAVYYRLDKAQEKLRMALEREDQDE